MEKFEDAPLLMDGRKDSAVTAARGAINVNLRKLEERQNDQGFLELWGNTKLSVKRKLATYIHRNTGVLVDPASTPVLRWM